MDKQVYDMIREQSKNLAKLAAKNGVPVLVTDLDTVEDCKSAICVAENRLRELGVDTKADGIDDEVLREKMKDYLCKCVDDFIDDGYLREDDLEVEDEEEDEDDCDECDDDFNCYLHVHLNC